MNHIGELTQSFQATPKEPEITPDAGEYINKIFQRLITLCPAWKNGLDGDPNVWAAGYKVELVRAMKQAGVTKGEQINRGIDEYRKLGRPFLPAPGEFAQLCIGARDQHNTAAYRIVDRRRLLAKPKAKQEIAMYHIDKMRWVL